ncbi:MAG TPA: HU family DNA-binding protein [bacterium]|nr:HU family DNA-binding protein [bacterium]HPN81523.1 HU family DNA-binding protein [bacterium]HPW39672.1 HU family DNA-binding protein [bacterium]
MNKAQLSEKIADKVGISRAQAEAAIESFVDITINELRNGGEVTLTGFGTFSARRRKGREGINPRNPEEKITIPSVVVAKFKAGKNLKEALKKEESSAVGSSINDENGVADEI